ncbi:amidohydrolase family protein [Alienimonas sp. DA493]|uniref:amidohydrolase family protein n=1 Tax=Alienimonas sp. DA493 TaxID=3373605 RepID=UPI003753FD2C
MSEPAAPPSALTARWVAPIDVPPIAGGTVELTPDGRVAAVHDRPDARSGAEDLGDVALLPGFVNCHTHLEFSDFAAPIPAAGAFADWIAATVAARRERPGDRMDRVNRGLAESLAAGVTTVGEIATGAPEADGWNAARLPPPHARPALVAFGELIAPRDPVAALDAARAFLQSDGDPPDLIRGLSPHAPYSVHPAVPTLLAACPDTAAAPWAVHLLETSEEIDLLAKGQGPLAAAMERLGATRSDFGANRLRRDYLEPLATAARGLIVHGNRLTPADLDWLAAPERRHLSVIYCPRTHAHFGRPPHPWLALREAGVRVALGTDGRGSNPDLSILGELRFLHAQFPKVPPADLLALGTRCGAEALGVGGGRLRGGEPADLCAVRPDGASGDPAADLLHSGSRVVAVWRAGRRVV